MKLFIVLITIAASVLAASAVSTQGVDAQVLVSTVAGTVTWFGMTKLVG